MALKFASSMILALLASSSLFDVSAAYGGRKALAPAPDTGVDNVGLAPTPADLGFTPLDMNDPKVVDLAKFATSEYNKANNAHLIFYQVYGAMSAVDAQETKYGLVILARDDADLILYSVRVSVVNDVKKVTSFSEY